MPDAQQSFKSLNRVLLIPYFSEIFGTGLLPVDFGYEKTSVAMLAFIFA